MVLTSHQTDCIDSGLALFLTHESPRSLWRIFFLLLLRSPVRSNGRSSVLLVMYLLSFFLFRHSFSELPRPIVLKLCHMVGIWMSFIIPLQKLGGLSPQKIWGPKTCKISVNFGPLQTLIANISGTAEDIQNRKTAQTTAIPPAFNEKSLCTLVH